MHVRIARLGEEVKIVELEANKTVRDAIAAAGLNPANTEVRVNAQPATMETVLQDNNIVTLAPTVKGGGV